MVIRSSLNSISVGSTLQSSIKQGKSVRACAIGIYFGEEGWLC